MIKERLKNGTVIFDGGMGTYFSARKKVSGEGCELANLDSSILIRAIHREYLDAGANAIKTNTFGTNRVAYNGNEKLVSRVIRNGYSIADRAAKPYDAEVFADIGPIRGIDESLLFEEYKFVIDCFLEAGATNFLFETNATFDGLGEATSYIKKIKPDAFVMVSFAVMGEGFTRDGLFGEELIHKAWNTGNIDAVGMNCVCSVNQMERLTAEMDLSGITFSVMPNASYPSVIENRTFYESNPDYFGEHLAALTEHGASIIGGCCGTTPSHIAAAVHALKELGDVRIKSYESSTQLLETEESPFWEKLSRGQKVIAVELDPPKIADVRKYVEDAERLKDAGVDSLTIADCPIGRARMDSSMLAVKIKREANLEAIPHMTCRDRNLNATKGLLLGLSAEGIRNVLFVTGDPIPTAERDEVKSVYQFNSRKMASFVRSLGEKNLVNPFHMFGALDVNSRNFKKYLELAEEKVENGMVGLFTQPVLSDEAVENLKEARKRLDCYILGGIMPIVSEKNALFMENEINGIHVSQDIIESYKGLERDEAEELAVSISLDIAKKIKCDVDGYYLMTPFNRVNLVARIAAELALLED